MPLEYPSLVLSETLVLPVSSTAASYGISAPGYTQSVSTALGAIDCQHAQTANIRFFIDGSNNNTFTCRIYGRSGTVGGLDFQMTYLGLATCTAGTAHGSSGGTVTLAQLFVDTIVWTPSSAATSPTGPMTTISTARGTSPGVAHSPADNTIATLELNELCGAQSLYFDFNTGGSATGMNALVELSRN